MAAGLRWERGENDSIKLPDADHKMYRQLLAKLLWLGRADLRCALGRALTSLGRASETDMRNIKGFLRYLKCNLGILSVELSQFGIEAAKRAVKGSILMHPATTQMTIALSSGEGELVAALSGACDGCALRWLWWWLLEFGCPDEIEPTRYLDQHQPTEGFASARHDHPTTASHPHMRVSTHIFLFTQSVWSIRL